MEKKIASLKRRLWQDIQLIQSNLTESKKSYKVMKEMGNLFDTLDVKHDLQQVEICTQSALEKIKEIAKLQSEIEDKNV